MTRPAKPKRKPRWYVVVEVGSRELARWAKKEMAECPDPRGRWAARIVRCDGVLR